MIPPNLHAMRAQDFVNIVSRDHDAYPAEVRAEIENAVFCLLDAKTHFQKASRIQEELKKGSTP